MGAGSLAAHPYHGPMAWLTNARTLGIIAIIAALSWALTRDPEPERALIGCVRAACLHMVITEDATEIELANGETRTGTVRVELGGAPIGTAVVPAGTTQVVASVPTASLRNGSLLWWFVPVEAGAQHASGILYRLPFRGRWQLTQGNHGQYSHFDELAYAFDFRMDQGTRVVAARAGEVVWVVEDKEVGGPDPALADQANFVTVLHEDGTLANYTHLRPGGAAVEPGMRVEVGDLIGFSGNTGFSSEPHLHFHVWRLRNDMSYESLPIRFDDGSGRPVIPMEGGIYGR
jgi:murein DD-endopeptidase MepM/ murein hydrolase activator NlpD